MLAPTRLAIMPPAALAGVVRYFHIELHSPGAVLVPATPCPMLTFFIRGGSRFSQDGGRVRLLDQPFVTGPLVQHFPSVWEPGTTFISVRRLQRRVMASYGQSLRDGRRMMRYIRALSSMLGTPPRYGALTRVAVDSGYHDQAHMVRDFVQYTGLAPRALLAAAGDAAGALRLLRYDDASRAVVTRLD